MRVAFGGPVGLDFTAVIAVATLRGCAGPLLADVLRPVEALLLASFRKDD